jgi:hypothetical protein
LTSNNFALAAIKRYVPFSQLVKAKIEEQFPHINGSSDATYFTEVQDRLLLINDHLVYEDN